MRLTFTLLAVAMMITTAPAWSQAKSDDETIVRIRCFSTIPESSDPLVILDGKIIEYKDFQALKPEQIADLEILKGDMTTAIYGVRGMNGVIVVKSKTEEELKIEEALAADLTDPQWYRKGDQVFFQLDHREVVVKTEIVNAKGQVLQENHGYDEDRGLQIEEIPQNEPMFLVLTTARGQKTFRMMLAGE